MAKTNPIECFEIYVDDKTRAKKFYESVFETELEKLEDPIESDSPMEMLAFPSDMKEICAADALTKMKGYPAGGLGSVVYFNCDDCAIEESRVVAAGGKI